MDIDGPASPNAKSLPEWAPVELKDLDEQLPQQLDWAGYDEFGGADGSFTRNGHTISAEKARLYLFDDLGVSQRWTNKFSEVGIETVGDLVGKSEEDLLRIDGIGAKAIEELRDGLEAHDLLYILENNDDVADEEDLSQLLQMVFSPDGPDDILLGTSAPTHHADATRSSWAPRSTTRRLPPTARSTRTWLPSTSCSTSSWTPTTPKRPRTTTRSN